MTLDQLRAFNAVVKYGSIRAASIQIHKSAPSISSAIKALESRTGLTLFSRDGYRLVVSEKGKEFYGKATQIIRSASELSSFSKQKWKKKEKKFLIAIDALVPFEQVVSLIETVELAFPDTQFNLYVEHLGCALDKPYSEEIDLAISSINAMQSEDLEIKYLFSVCTIPVASSQSLIAKKSEPIRQGQIIDELQIVVKSTSIKWQNQTSSVVPGARSFYVSDLNTQKSLILAGVGWGYLPEHMVKTDIENGSLHTLDLENCPRHSSEQYLIRRSEQEVGRVAQKAWTTFSTLNNHESSVAS
ncbi:MAG: LysR family transcriptional regulator [Paraglaciecola sp.]|nr:LysR family transcriptional regulator [Paraglaciecola sp.]